MHITAATVNDHGSRFDCVQCNLKLLSFRLAIQVHYQVHTAMSQLPVFLSIPHGNLTIPREVANRLELRNRQVFFDSDAFTEVLFGLGENVVSTVKAEVARIIVDVNRSPTKLPPKFPDGIIKRMTTYGREVYTPGMEPDERLIRDLMEKYYYTYFQRIEDEIRCNGTRVQLGIDCHTMAEKGPSTRRDAGKQRPLICLGNRRGETCTPGMLAKLKACFIEAYGIPDREIRLNRPFRGGYIVHRFANKPFPWVQVEISRALYLRPPWFNRETLEMDMGHITDMRKKFQAALEFFFNN